MSLANKLLYLEQTKTNIADAIRLHQTVISTDTTFRDYAGLIQNIDSVKALNISTSIKDILFSGKKKIEYNKDVYLIYDPKEYDVGEDDGLSRETDEPIDEFKFQVEDIGQFDIPVSGVNGDIKSFQNFNWKVNWGDGNIQTVSGIGSATATIPHTYTDGKQKHYITIQPNGTETQGWFNAFGSSESQNKSNLARITAVFSPITSLMRTMNDYSHYQMFYYCIGLTTIPNNLLPATTLATMCYMEMFYSCNSLTIPDNLLPATTLATGCYAKMFYKSIGLKNIPNNLLPATTLAKDCYEYMFADCESLTIIPNSLLPATTMVQNCYGSMFRNCTRLTAIPSDLLPATTLAEMCYGYMFANCSGLKAIPSDLLPATTLARGCYSAMFYNNLGLTSLPENLLPATTLADNCYEFMFWYCNKLSLIPNNLLPATTLADNCYQCMFHSCSRLSRLPAGLLPATALFNFCYDNMFAYCDGLIMLPDNLLPATTLVQGCYKDMFRNCKILENIGTIDLLWFVINRSQSGMFYNDTRITTPVGYNEIPAEWKSE